MNLAVDGSGQTGTRIRERRIDLGLRQADLAKSLGISPSYLNLIEHNRRRIAGPLLNEVGVALNVDPTLLTQGAERAVLDNLRAAAAVADVAPEVDRTDELAARYPGWAGIIVAQHARLLALEGRIEELTDRMSHDPELATSLHAVISSVTSIRSTAAILTSEERLDQDWLSRFHNNIHDDAIRLASSSDALVRYLDAPVDQGAPLSPTDEVAQFLNNASFHMPALERAKANPIKIAQNAELSSLGTDLLLAYLAQYHRNACAMPLAALEEAIATVGLCPDTLALHFDVTLDRMLNRLGTLPQKAGLPAMGLAVCDGSGAISLQKQIPGFALSHSGFTCPLWPLFTAISQPERPIRAAVMLPGQHEDRFLCYAVATQTSGGLKMPPVVTSTMLVVADPDVTAKDALAIGPACRICPRADCPARREPSALGAIL